MGAMKPESLWHQYSQLLDTPKFDPQSAAVVDFMDANRQKISKHQ